MNAVLEGQTLTDRWLEHLADGRELSPRTVATYRDALADFCRRMDLDRPEQANLAILDRYRFRLKNAGLSAGTRRLRLQGVVSFFRYAKSRGLVAEDPTVNFEIPKAKSFASIPTFEGWEIELLVKSAPVVVTKGRREPEKFFAKRKAWADLSELRNSAVIALAYACGLRRSEVSLLARDDYEGKYLHVRGAKGAQTVQTIQIMKRAQFEMLPYLEALAESRWVQHPALFPPLHGDQRRTHPGDGISDDAFAWILASRVARAGIIARGRRLSPHTLRYSVASHLHECGYSPLEISRHLRHQRLETLERYVKRAAYGLPRRLTFRPHPWILGKAFTRDSDFSLE